MPQRTIPVPQGNRHCPNCGGLKREQWIDNRMSELLLTPYYHLFYSTRIKSADYSQPKSVVQTPLMPLPKPLSIMADAHYLGADCGITMVLHTWGQQLNFHPHVHCIVTEVVLMGKMGKPNA
jgi:hypothetical protein